MPSATPANLAARERLRDHQTTAARAVAALSAAVAGLDATSTHRNKFVAAQDSFVAAMRVSGVNVPKWQGIQLLTRVISISARWWDSG